MTISSNDPIYLTYIGFVAGLVLFYYGFRIRQRFKIIEGTPTSKIRSVAVGLVELRGRAEIEGQSLVSPFSQLECVFYSYHVQQRKGSGKKKSWVTVARYQTDQLFRIRDETGSILVSPQNAECHFKIDRQYRTQLFGSEQEGVFKAGLDRIGIDYQGFLGEKTLRCSETYIAPNDLLYVLGSAVVRKGVVSSERNQDNLCVSRAERDLLILADRSEKDLLSALKWKMYASIFGGPLLTIVCLAYVLNRFNI